MKVCRVSTNKILGIFNQQACLRMYTVALISSATGEIPAPDFRDNSVLREFKKMVLLPFSILTSKILVKVVLTSYISTVKMDASPRSVYMHCFRTQLQIQAFTF